MLCILSLYTLFCPNHTTLKLILFSFEIWPNSHSSLEIDSCFSQSLSQSSSSDLSPDLIRSLFSTWLSINLGIEVRVRQDIAGFHITGGSQSLCKYSVNLLTYVQVLYGVVFGVEELIFFYAFWFFLVEKLSLSDYCVVYVGCVWFQWKILDLGDTFLSFCQKIWIPVVSLWFGVKIKHF